MAHILIIGAGLGGLPTAYEIRHRLPSQHQVTLISDRVEFTFIPSLPWVALGMKTLADLQVPLAARLQRRNIHWIQGRVTQLSPEQKVVVAR